MSGETVVAPFASGEITALQAGNGTELWSYVLSLTNRNNALSEIRDIAGRPVIYRGDVLAGSHSGVFAAVDLRSGQPRWSLPIVTTTSPWPAGDVVSDRIVVLSSAGELRALDAKTGKTLKSLNLKVKGGVTLSPAIAGGELFIATEDAELLAVR